MKKIFTLISGKELKQTSNDAIIPAEEFADLVTARELIDVIKAEAEQYRKEVVQECALLKEQAQKEGFEAGLQQWANKMMQLQTDYDQVRAQIEKAAVNVALTASKKILGRELELHPETIADIVATHLKTVSQYRKVIIYISQFDLKNLEQNKEKLKPIFDRLETLSIKERDDVQPGGFIIETEGGIINLSTVDKQWKPIEAMFRSFEDPSLDSV